MTLTKPAMKFTIANPAGGPAASTATIDASGTGALVFSNIGALANSTTNSQRNLVLTGSSASGLVNVFAPILNNNGSTQSTLTKTGSNTCALTGNMGGATGYTGATQVQQGRLILSRMNGSAANGVLNNSAITVLNEATLGVYVGSGANNSYTAGLTTAAAAGAALNLQSGSTFTMTGDGQIGTFNLPQGSSMATALSM